MLPYFFFPHVFMSHVFLCIAAFFIFVDDWPVLPASMYLGKIISICFQRGVLQSSYQNSVFSK